MGPASQPVITVQLDTIGTGTKPNIIVLQILMVTSGKDIGIKIKDKMIMVKKNFQVRGLTDGLKGT